MNQDTWAAVEAYFETALLPADVALDAALEASVAAGLPPMQVSASQGRFLQLLAQAQGARRILEIGTLGGYSALWLVRALPADGRLVTLERDPLHAEVARGNFQRAGVADRLELIEGAALDSLARLRVGPVTPFDFFFIDADKPNNAGYLQAALALSRPGSLIVVDNVVRGGTVVARQRSPSAEGVRRLIDLVAAEPRLQATVIQTVGDKGYDGFLLARVQTS